MNNKNKIQENEEFWQIDKSVKRLIWRLAPKDNRDYTSFKPNENDFNALKSILGSLDRSKKISVSNNVLFAKLYIYYLTMNIRHYNTTVFNDIPQKELSNLLSKPLGLFYDGFYNDLHNNQLNTKDVVDVELLKQIIQLKETYNKDLIISKLDDMINKALKRFS